MRRQARRVRLPVGTCDRLRARLRCQGRAFLLERRLASTQLCAPDADASTFARPIAPRQVSDLCEEGQYYGVCRAGLVVDCSSNVAVGACLRGCAAEGLSIDDGALGREAVFAIFVFAVMRTALP